MNAKKIDLVRQMLAKAESTTPEEAEALTAAAEKIMLRLGIDDAMLAASDKKARDTSPVVSKVMTFEGVYRLGMMTSMYQVLQALQTCSAIRSSGRNTETMHIYGRESQVDRAILLLSSLEIQAMVAMRDWWKTNKDAYVYHTESQRQRVRRQFIVSFGKGAADRIKSERTEVEEQVAGSALVLRSEVAAARAKIAEEHGRLSKGRGLRGGGNHAAEAGRAAGQRANVGTTQVGSRKQIGA